MRHGSPAVQVPGLQIPPVRAEQENTGRAPCCLSLPKWARNALTDLAEGLASHHRPEWPPPSRHAGNTLTASAGGLGDSAAHGWCPGLEGCQSSSSSPLLPAESPPSQVSLRCHSFWLCSLSDPPSMFSFSVTNPGP